MPNDTADLTITHLARYAVRAGDRWTLYILERGEQPARTVGIIDMVALGGYAYRYDVTIQGALWPMTAQLAASLMQVIDAREAMLWLVRKWVTSHLDTPAKKSVVQIWATLLRVKSEQLTRESLDALQRHLR